MIENQVILRVKKDKRDYVFSLQPDSPLGEVFDVLTEMRAEIVSRIQNSSVDPKHKEEQKYCEKEPCSEEGNVQKEA